MREAYLEYYGTFQKPREYMSQVTTTERKDYDTNISIILTDLVTWVLLSNTLIYLRTQL